MNDEQRAPLQGGHNGDSASTDKSAHVFERTLNDGNFKLQVAVNAFSRIIVSINDISVTVLAEDGLEAVWHELLLAGALGPAVDSHVRFKLLNNISFMHRDAIIWLEEAQRQAKGQRKARNNKVVVRT
ncbi:MAG: hypothetical protein JRM78_04180 [Nitrososphaerota archaeon]|nr:hypothetical protein [Nitrososphaerota archaeon]MDG7047624.1 hypothetical protein [Nitrososphaerota archaeon]